MVKDTKKSKGGKKSDKVEPIYEELAKNIIGYRPDYLPRIIKEMYSLDEAKICAELPAPAEEIAEKLNLDKEYVKKKLDKMVRKGSLMKTDKGIMFPWWQEQFGDVGISNQFFDEERSEEFWRLMGKWVLDEQANEESMKLVFGNLGGDVEVPASMRIIPRWKAIKDIPGVMPCEDVREILKEAEKTQRLNSSRCACRATRRSGVCPVDEGTVPWEGLCIHVGGVARYHAEVLKCTPYQPAEYILEKLERHEKVPWYHMSNNFRVVAALCSCCACDCHVRLMEVIAQKNYNRRLINPSRFLSVVDSQKCTAKAGCKDCLSLCPWQALQLEDGTVKVDADKCYGCGVCVVNCPEKALQLKIVRPAAHIPEGGDVDMLYKAFTTHPAQAAK